MNVRESSMASAFLPSVIADDYNSLIIGRNRGKSAGVDGMIIRDLRVNFQSAKNVPLMILNSIIKTGVFSNKIKIAATIPPLEGRCPSIP